MKIVVRTQIPLSSQDEAHFNTAWRNQPLKSPLSLSVKVSDMTGILAICPKTDMYMAVALC